VAKKEKRGHKDTKTPSSSKFIVHSLLEKEKEGPQRHKDSK
jgi:hypothetical protein